MEETILQLVHVTGKKQRNGFQITDVMMQLREGYIYAIAGENGAGKTTLLELIGREDSRYTGNMIFDGMDLKAEHAKAMEAIGIISEDCLFFEDRNGKENAAILGDFYEYYEKERFFSYCKRFQVPLCTSYINLSRGEKIKWQICFAAARNCRLYMLDEATAGMDPVFRKVFFDLLHEIMAQTKACILMTDHNLHEISRQTDYVAYMENGRLSGWKESMEVEADVWI
ncbi:aBC-2 type transport system ATP-binding protein [Firmicutes bacterium CAG:194]|nr:aBC-2 type transport system ATP-binding protein [Firmicutes bacterium CAG:194]